ncbi:Flp family type IVb pilin [Burkholderia sp. SR8]|uniref:Flp family type IVb pilin n=1 Tax=Burkholderia sp. SR8 TaxID=3062277 RepID=UPI00406430A4
MNDEVCGRLGRCSARAAITLPTDRKPEIVMKANMRAALARIGDEQGATSIEYALLGAMFAVAVLGSVVTLRSSVNDTFQVIAAAVTAAVTTALALVS